MQNARADLVDMDQVTAYLNLLFGNVNWAETPFISLLGIGEKGTGGEGKFRERKWVDMRWPFAGSQIREHLTRWAQWEAAAFIVPAAFRAESKDVKEDKIEALTAVLVDIDSGDVPEKLEHAAEWLGDPSFVVRSGGKTETGADKIHAYWLLDELGDPATVAAMRETLAVKIGGDPSFKRLTQVIRMPGSVYGKGGVALPVRLEVGNERQHALHDMADAIMDMPAAFGSAVLTVSPRLDPVTGAMDFSAGRGLSMRRVETALTTEVHEGGDTDFNRWGQFSSVAGHHIHLARMGMQTIEDAARNVNGWVLANMVPPWPDERIRTEFIGLLNHDVEKSGPMPTFDGPPGTGVAIAQIESIETGDELLSWAVHRRSSPEPKQRRVLVDGLVFSAKRHMLVAEGGAGKTFLMMDLALKLAACGPEHPDLEWMGQKIEKEAWGGTVIIMTGEDDAEELDIRWNAIDPSGVLRAAAGDRLIALPLDNLGGAFPLVSMHPATREAIASDRWAKLYRAMRDVHQRGGFISFVGIDTLNSTLHGEENSAMVIGEYVRAVAPICGELKAALLVTHHVRKPGAEPIRDLDDMRAAIRGSTALPNAMRMVIGVWHADRWQTKLKQMGMEPARHRLYKMGVVKTNMPAMEGERYLMRQDSGVLMDVTERERQTRPADYLLKRWIYFCVKYYAERGKFFVVSADAKHGMAEQKNLLPPALAKVPKTKIAKLCDEMSAQGGPLVLRTVAKAPLGAGKAMQWLDTAKRAQDIKTAYWHEDGKGPACCPFDQYFYNEASERIEFMGEGPSRFMAENGGETGKSGIGDEYE